MSQENLSLSSYQLRIALLRTSPHVWRRVLVRCHCTLPQLHQTIRTLFGWSVLHPARFLIRGKIFPAGQTGACAPTRPIRLSELQLYGRERFFYDYRFELQTPVWRHEIRVERIMPVQEEWDYPRCVAGAGMLPPDSVASPQEFRHMGQQKGTCDQTQQKLSADERRSSYTCRCGARHSNSSQVVQQA